jgi:hypothetical protein
MQFFKDGVLLVRVFTLAFNALHGGFSDEPVRVFLKGKELLSLIMIAFRTWYETHPLLSIITFRSRSSLLMGTIH